jgi:hypothetical protein
MLSAIGADEAAGVGGVVVDAEEDDDDDGDEEDPEHPPSRVTRLAAAMATLTPRRAGIGPSGHELIGAS